MTRSSKLTLVSLFIGLMSLASVGTASADTPCTGVVREHCEWLAAQQSLTLQAAPYTGVAREQYDTIQAGQLAALPVSTVYEPGPAFEHYEQMMAASASN